MKIGLYNLWLLFIPAYAVIWIVMIYVNRKRGKPIEDPKLMQNNKNEQLIFGFIPHLLLIAISIVVPINPGSLFYFGLLFLIIGFLIDIISILTFTNEETGLNTKGIYSFSRNPMYIGGFLMIAGLNITGFSFSSASIIFFVVSVIWIACTHRIVLNEEKFLLHKYGDAYSAYKQKTLRYFGICRQ
ncbi:MAG: isoprenylcysteine carboxylmethyltransferase family protein [bacterium]